MGQITHGVMFGCKYPKFPKGTEWNGDSVKKGDEWVYQKGLADVYKSPRGACLRLDEEYNVIGFCIAVGASGEDGCPDLKGPIDMAGFDTDKRYAKATRKARDAWAHLAAFFAEHGVKHEEPRLWLVELEVA